LDVGLWGLTDLPSEPDHHVVVLFNNVQVAEMVFDGNTDQPLTVALPAGALKSSGNALTLRLPGDTGATYDIVALDKYSVTYPRAFVAREGRLSFNAKGQVFEVQGLPTPNVLVYRLDAKGLARLSRTDVAGAGTGYRARFAGTNEAATYLVSNVESMLAPAIRPARSVADITSGPAQYLIISHPDFIAGLGPLVDARRAQGLTVKVVDVEDVYAQFSNGIFDPQGIKAYVGYAIEKMGTEYVLLVGGDSYDYQNNLGLGSLSFIPSLYTQTDAIVKFAPVDPLLTDVNGDNVPDRPIGRLPVRTSAELQIVIQKTLAYQNKTYNRTAVFAADAFDAAA